MTSAVTTATRAGPARRSVTFCDGMLRGLYRSEGLQLAAVEATMCLRSEGGAAMPVALQEVWFENPTVGQRSRILALPGQSGGRQFVLEYVTRLYGGEHANPAHLHTTVTETFEILKGRARYRVGSETRIAVAGDRVEMPPLVPHVHPWSDSLQELHVRHTAVSNPPDLRGLNATLQAEITIQGLARLGLVNGRGLPNPLQLA